MTPDDDGLGFFRGALIGLGASIPIWLFLALVWFYVGAGID